jgi:general secretion pathway protein G
MTIVEIMVVMTIIAIIAGAASFALVPALKRAKVKQTAADAKTIASAAELYMVETDECPADVDELISSKTLKQSASTRDAWDNDFQIECDDDGATVRSAGPDETMGTEDDIE